MAGVLGLLMGGGFLAMVGTFGYQSYLYLKHGEWIGLSVTYACGAFLEWGWCNFPQNWLGVHKILSWINVGFFVFICAVVALLVFAAAEDGK